jgi:hypothetical protein
MAVVRRPMHLEHRFGRNQSIVGKAAGTQDRPSFGRLVNSIFEERLVNVNADNLPEYEPSLGLLAGRILKLDDLDELTFHSDRLSPTRGTDTDRLGTGVKPASWNSSISRGTPDAVAFIFSASSIVTRFQTNSPVLSIVATLSFQLVLENPSI